MLIFGWSTRSSVRGTGEFGCPVCQAKRPFVVVDQQRWFTLFFIPIIPLGRFGEQLQCRGCGTTYDPAILNRPMTSGVIQAQLASDYIATGPVDAHPPHTAGALDSSPFSPRSDGLPPASTITTSGLSIGSLISGILSPFLIVVCFSSLISSIIAIITGHLALANIRRSGGWVRGQWQAITGLALGYLSLALTFAAILYLGTRMGNGDRADASPSGRATSSVTGAVGNSPEGRLKHAESLVAARRGQEVGFGNNAQAQQLAEDFATRMKAIDEKLFTQTRPRIVQLSGGEFLTYCELQTDRCAFIVHVPSYRDYTKDAKELLATAAWYLAADVVSGVVEPGGKLAVGLRGSLLYGDVMTGVVGDDADGEEPFSRGDSENLLAYFANPRSTGVVNGALANTPNEERSDHDSVAAEMIDETAADVFNTPPKVPANSISPYPVPAVQSPAEVATNAAPQERTDAMLPEVASSNYNPSPRVARTKPREEPKLTNKVPVELVWETPAQGWNIQAMAFSADARWIAMGRIDQHVSMHEVATGREVYRSDRMDKLSSIVALAFAHDGMHLLAGGASGATCAFPGDSSGHLGEPQFLYRHARDAGCIITSQRHRFAISGGQDGTVAWEPFGGQTAPPRLLQKLERQVLAIDLPHEGTHAAATDGRTLVRFDLRTAQELDSQVLSKSPARAAAFRADGQHVAVCFGSEVQVFDAQTGGLLQTLVSPDRQSQWSVTYLPHSNWLLTGGRGVVTLWDVEVGERLAVLDLGGQLYVQTMAITRDGTLIAAVPSAAGQSVRLFRLPKFEGP